MPFGSLATFLPGCHALHMQLAVHNCKDAQFDLVPVAGLRDTYRSEMGSHRRNACHWERTNGIRLDG